MLTVRTDDNGARHYCAPRAFVDVAVALFPRGTEVDAVFMLAKKFTWHDAHTIEQIAMNASQSEALAFARERLRRKATP